MRNPWVRILSLVLVPVMVLAALPTVCAADEFSESSSEGAAITIGLFATALVVLFIISLKQDVSNVFGRESAPVDTEALAQQLASVLDRGPADEKPDVNRPGGLAQVRGSGVGFRIEF